MISVDEAVRRVSELVDGGMRLKAACKQIGAWTAHSNRELYDEYLRAREENK